MDIIIQDIRGQFIYVPRAIILTFAFIFVFLFIERENKKYIKKKLAYLRRRPSILAFLFWSALIMTSTLIGRWPEIPYYHIFDDFGFFNEGGLNKEMIENVLLFVPYSFFYLQAFRSARPWKSSLLLSAYTSSFIEVSQLIFWLGSFQFSDLVHNTAGGLIGCGIWCLMNKLYGYAIKK